MHLFVSLRLGCTFGKCCCPQKILLPLVIFKLYLRNKQGLFSWLFLGLFMVIKVFSGWQQCRERQRRFHFVIFWLLLFKNPLFLSLSNVLTSISRFSSQCFSTNAALHTKDGLHPQVKAACQVQRTDSVR